MFANFKFHCYILIPRKCPHQTLFQHTVPPIAYCRSANPISTSGSDYAHYITTCPPPCTNIKLFAKFFSLYIDLPTLDFQLCPYIILLYVLCTYIYGKHGKGSFNNHVAKIGGRGSVECPDLVI